MNSEKVCTAVVVSADGDRKAQHGRRTKTSQSFDGYLPELTTSIAGKKRDERMYL